MSALTIRNLEDETKQLLRIKAAKNGVSLEEEVRAILRREARSNATAPRYTNLYDAIRDLVEPHGGFDLEIPERSLAERDPPFKDWS